MCVWCVCVHVRACTCVCVSCVGESVCVLKLRFEKNSVIHKDISLVPRPIPPPLFECLQYVGLPYLHTANDPILAVGMTWERGKHI